MDLSSKLLSNAVDEISKLPGIGKSTALRLALHLINKEEGDIDNLLKSIKQLKESVLFCERCKSLSDNKICNICATKEAIVNIFHREAITIINCSQEDVALKRLDVLREDQADYIGVSVEGPYKPESYRY